MHFLVLIFGSWVWYVVYLIMQESRKKAFERFCLENAEKLLNDEECEFKGKMFKGSDVVASYQMCVSILVLTMTRKTAFYSVGDASPAICCTLITALGGWWGFPWGPIRSVQTFINNAKDSENYTPLNSYIRYLMVTNSDKKGI